MKITFIILFLFTFVSLNQSISAQDKLYPNELENFHFFDKGNLKGLRIAVSAKEDVEKNFGSYCSETCDYGENWNIQFIYFGDFTRSATNILTKQTDRFAPKPEYRNKIYSVTLFPKTQVSVKDIIFSSEFDKIPGNVSKSSSLIKGFVYQDNSGLSYRIAELAIKRLKVKDTNDLPKIIIPETDNNWQKGDLIEIRYGIPEKSHGDFFVKISEN